MWYSIFLCKGGYRHSSWPVQKFFRAPTTNFFLPTHLIQHCRFETKSENLGALILANAWDWRRYTVFSLLRCLHRSKLSSVHFAYFQWDNCGLLTLRAVGCGILRFYLWDFLVGSIDGASIVIACLSTVGSRLSVVGYCGHCACFSRRF